MTFFSTVFIATLVAAAIFGLAFIIVTSYAVYTTKRPLSDEFRSNREAIKRLFL